MGHDSEERRGGDQTQEEEGDGECERWMRMRIRKGGRGKE